MTALRCMRAVVAWLLLTGAMNAGCYAASEPNAADTNTNWLKCENDADCSRGERCVENVCTQHGAQVASNPEESPSNTNGPSGTVPGGADSPSVSDGATGDVEPEVEPDVEPASVASIADVLWEDGSFDISDRTGTAGPPAVRWVRDHFAVVFSTGVVAAPDEQLEVARVYGDRIDTYGRAYDRVATGVAIAEDGDIAVGGYYDSAIECAADFFTPRLVDQRQRMIVTCDDDKMVVQASSRAGEWMVATADVSALYWGRYDALAGRWSVLSTTITPHNGARTFAMSKDVAEPTVVWGGKPLGGDDGGDVAHRVLGTSTAVKVRPAPPTATWGVPATIEAAVWPDGAFVVVDLARSVLVLGTNGAELWSSVLSDGGGATAIGTVASTNIIDRLPGFAAIPERDLVGICFATGPGPGGGALGRHDGVSFIMIDGSGQPVGEPQYVADGLGNVGGCDVAWSGEEFLVVWWDIDQAPDPARSVIRGMRFPAPD